MLVFMGARLVIIQNTRVGSTYLAKTLASLADGNLPPWHGKHSSYREANAFFDKLLPGMQFEYFAVVRHPLAWAQSWMRIQRPTHCEPTADDTKVLSNYIVEKYTNRPQETQYPKLEGMPLKNIFLYERLGEFYSFIDNKLDLTNVGLSLELLKSEISGDQVVSELDRGLSQLSWEARRILELDAQIYFEVRESKC